MLRRVCLRRVHVKIGAMPERVCLLNERVNQLFVAMPEAQNRNAAAEVEIFFAVFVPNMRALAFYKSNRAFAVIACRIFFVFFRNFHNLNEL